MELNVRRSISAWLLLAVFLPMLLVSSAHVHRYGHETQEECRQCTAHHKVHGSHVAKAQAAMHDCVLCQILHLTFLRSSSVVATAPECRILSMSQERTEGLVTLPTGAHAPRAPPVC
ncbi:MAG: hypothetical protein IJ762_00085 [Bacteroidaceae bacterium]|nr:hypothetical protein [Bacteroidaceae bacterium]